MSNWIFEDSINWVYDRLRDAQAVGKPLNYVKTVVQGHRPNLDYGAGTAPGLLVRLQDPERDGKWAMTASKTRDEDLSIIIEMWIHPESVERPYGHRPTNKRGFLTLVSDVGNVLESHIEWPFFGADPATAPSFDADYQGLGHTVEHELYRGAAIVIPKLRFTAGQR